MLGETLANVGGLGKPDGLVPSSLAALTQLCYSTLTVSPLTMALIYHID